MESCLPGMVFSAKQHIASIESVRRLAEETWAIRVHVPELAERILPGQFFMIRPESGSDPLLGRPFALFDTFEGKDGSPAGIDFGFVRVGKMTTLMKSWQAGDEVRIWGPLGNGFPVPDCEHLICVAGGIGQTPFLGVVKEALGQKSYGQPRRQFSRRPSTVTMCYGVRSERYLAGLDEFRVPNLQLRIATDDGSYGHHGYVTDLLRDELSAGRAETHVYCCGPEPMMMAVAKLCEQMQVPCWLSLETPMACGFGACFSCVTRVKDDDGSWDYRRTCVEGPVFPASKLVHS